MSSIHPQSWVMAAIWAAVSAAPVAPLVPAVPDVLVSAVVVLAVVLVSAPVVAEPVVSVPVVPVVPLAMVSVPVVAEPVVSVPVVAVVPVVPVVPLAIVSVPVVAEPVVSVPVAEPELPALAVMVEQSDRTWACCSAVRDAQPVFTSSSVFNVPALKSLKNAPVMVVSQSGAPELIPVEGVVVAVPVVVLVPVSV
jgi:hypothetical protein